MSDNRKRWQFVTDLHGNIEPYTLEHGVIYEFSCLLTPGSRVRVVDEHGVSRIAARAAENNYYPVTFPLTFIREFGDSVAIQYQGEVSDIYFRVCGINREEFNK